MVASDQLRRVELTDAAANLLKQLTSQQRLLRRGP